MSRNRLKSFLVCKISLTMGHGAQISAVSADCSGRAPKQKKQIDRVAIGGENTSCTWQVIEKDDYSKMLVDFFEALLTIKPVSTPQLKNFLIVPSEQALAASSFSVP